jgi:hypothetical protein
MPGDTITVRKVLNNGAVSLESNSPLVKTGSDLFNLEQKERAAKKQIYGALSDNLVNKLSQLNDTDSLIVKIVLKIQPQSVPLDKTKYSVDQLMAQAKEYLNRVPMIDKTTFINKYGIVKASLSNKNMDAAYDGTPEIIISKTSKKILHNMYLDNKIASIEEYTEKKPCCNNCQNVKGAWQYNPPCLSTLAASAYNVYTQNPSHPMPSSAMGQGVNAATFESGLRTNFVNCINLGSKLIHADTGYNYSNEISHSEQCFRCLTDVAPQANFIHIWGDVSSITFHPAIFNWNIQTVSQSMTNSSDPLNPEMINIDLWAYSYPYPVFCNPTANDGYCHTANWGCYNAINVGNVQHHHLNHYMQLDTALQTYCNVCVYDSTHGYGKYVGHCNGGTEQAANPPPRADYGNPALYNPFNCNPSCCPSCDPGNRGDHELPMVVAPGISPSCEPDSTGSFMSDPCFLNDSGNHSLCGSQGTSYSAPVCNGIAACVISADSRMLWWPEKVRAVILATAQNIDFNYWNYQQDGRDGAGTICGSDAVWLAKNHTTINSPNNTAAPYGICANTLGTGFQGQYMQFNISIPNPKPSGKHLRVVLTWDSSPSTTNGTNELSDLDLSMYGNNSGYNSLSYESNVEMVDVPSSDLTTGNTYVAQVYGNAMRISSTAFYIYYAIAWTWVKDQAN